MPNRTLSQHYARLFGWGLIAAGILGLAGAFDAKPWHSVFHIVTGLIGLAAWRSASSARAYALAFGVIYVVLGVLGEGTVAHILVGAAGLLSAFVPRATPAPSTA